jgi:hypothetical protein
MQASKLSDDFAPAECESVMRWLVLCRHSSSEQIKFAYNENHYCWQPDVACVSCMHVLNFVQVKLKFCSPQTPTTIYLLHILLAHE